jgi:hypothetical protein
MQRINRVRPWLQNLNAPVAEDVAPKTVTEDLATKCEQTVWRGPNLETLRRVASRRARTELNFAVDILFN